ncbi:hypothetical protein Tco_0217180 [Tanacetum coccineum]
MKAEALKVQNTRPIKALTVYPPNTPATLVPRVLPTKSQVKINIFTLRQLFSEFEKTCKKRITPTGITEGERGFEQTKTCYLTEVIPFFKTLQEHFEGIQKALTKEVKEMSDAFDELEAELDQSIVDRKHDAIERKNLLLEHDNIIADCLLKEVFYVASNSELNVVRFTEMQKAHHVVKTRCLELEVELSNLRDDIRKDNYNDLLNRFSNLEVNHLNLQLKYQNLKDSFQNKPSSSVNDTPDFNSVFVIGQMKASLQGKDNVIQKLKMQISQFQETHSELDRPLDLRGRDFQISQLTEEVNSLQEQNELFRVENAKINNLKEENLKKELHSVKLQLASTIQHNKLMVDEVTSLKKDFNQKENKYLEEFLDLKALKDKVEDKLFKQGQSIQTVHMMCKPRSYYDEVNKVAIGYKNPLCLHRARQVQPALYSGHVIVTPNHAPAVVRDCEETLEQSEISRKKMHDKMKANECVDNKVNITPPNYSKENFLATFTPQKQLTPEQIFWSQDIVKMKAEALKEQNTRPIKALTVYPPNTPATLVPRVLPTKSQVKINIFTLRQLFSEFEKTCKKRITPTGITEGERGFEQTKTCYLTEVIPFFKTLQEHFEGIQKALTKEVKEMSDAFDELEAELDQSIVDRKHDEIERKNLLIEHDNIIADGLSKEVFYVASNSELNASRFTEMQKAHNVVKARCLELEAELSNLRDNIHKDNYNELLNRFSNLEVNHLNLQLKYQNLKDSFQNKPSSSVNDTPDFNSVFVIGQMKASLQGKDNVIQKLKMEISQLKETRSELDRTLDFRARDFQISQLTEKVNGLQEQNELFRAENAKIKQHYKELYDSIKITRAKHTEQITALKNENENLKVQLHNTVSCVTTNQVKPNVLAPGKYAIDVEPIPPRNRNNREVHLVYLRHLKESVDTLREIVEEAKVERPLDRSLAFACRYTKHSQELLEYVFGTCPKVFHQQDKKHAHTPRKKQVTFEDQIATSSSNTHKHVEPMHTQKSNVPVPPSTGVNSCTDASGSQPRSILKKHRIPPAKSDSLKKVEDHRRNNLIPSLKTTNRIDSVLV